MTELRRDPACQLRSRLAALLDGRLRGRGAGGLAIARGAAPEIVVTWLPGALPREPAFLSYSITKTFTATLALVLQEEGRLTLDDPLARWLPEVPGAARIPVRRLLNHTAGVPDYGRLPAYHEAVRRTPGEPWSFDEFGDHTWQRGLLFEPGAGWAYSNPGYLLVKRVLERVADRSYAELVESRICRRLDLERSFVPETTAELAALAPAASTLLSPAHQPRDVRLAYHPGWVSHGVVASTPSEVARFLHALFSERIVGRASLRQLTTLVPVPKGPPRWREPSYGLGVMADPESPWGPVFGHGGGGPGYGASAFHAPRLAPGGASVCALCAVEEDFLTEDLVVDALDLLRAEP
jgi:D-alanyl-D-alanine carboxypeptidase